MKLIFACFCLISLSLVLLAKIFPTEKKASAAVLNKKPQSMLQARPVEPVKAPFTEYLSFLKPVDYYLYDRPLVMTQLNIY